MGLDARRGWTRFAGGALTTGAYALDLSRSGLWDASDRLGLRLAQPLRVDGGGLELHVGTSYDYATETAAFGWQRIGLTPSGRELIGEVGYDRNLWGGRIGANVYYRRHPGHIAGVDADRGAAIRFSRGL